MTTTSPTMQSAIVPRAGNTTAAATAAAPVKRISSASLMDQGREVEIEHAGRIYRLRITQLNKLILTA